MTWTGPGHQELVSCLAVKNETLRQINLCESNRYLNIRNRQKIIVDAYSVFADKTQFESENESILRHESSARFD